MSLERRIVLTCGFAGLAFALGCGGGGGGGTPITPTLATTIEIRDTDNYALSTNSLRAGDTFSLVLWGRDESGNIIFGSTSDWATTASSSVATVTGAGVITISSGGSVPISALAGKSTRNFTAVSGGGVVRGRVRNTTNQGVPDAVIRFYNNAGTQLLTAQTGSNGSFRTLVPGTATSFLVDVSGLGSKYYNQFGYGDKEWSTVCPSYRAPLPARSGNQVVTLPGDAVVTRNSPSDPPPPPPNCGL